MEKKKILHGNGYKQFIVEKDTTVRHLRYRVADILGNLGTIHHIDGNSPLDSLDPVYASAFTSFQWKKEKTAMELEEEEVMAQFLKKLKIGKQLTNNCHHISC